VRRTWLLVAAVVAYMVAAWMVAPGFYDGFGPQQPYNWTCPPSQAGANLKPSSGHADIKVLGGVSDAGSAFTNDGQIVVGFLPGAFDATGKTTISVDITPLPTCPQPPGILFVTNVYHVVASAPVAKRASVVLVYSNLEPAPTAIYQADDPAGPWKSIGAARDAMPFTITTTSASLGYFAAGYPQTTPASGPRIGGGQVLPIVVAILIGVVLLAGLPLAMLRRRRGRGGVEEEADEAKGSG
jgi:hypothetical protein